MEGQAGARAGVASRRVHAGSLGRSAGEREASASYTKVDPTCPASLSRCSPFDSTHEAEVDTMIAVVAGGASLAVRGPCGRGWTPSALGDKARGSERRDASCCSLCSPWATASGNCFRSACGGAPIRRVGEATSVVVMLVHTWTREVVERWRWRPTPSRRATPRRRTERRSTNESCGRYALAARLAAELLG